MNICFDTLTSSQFDELTSALFDSLQSSIPYYFEVVAAQLFQPMYEAMEIVK